MPESTAQSGGTADVAAQPGEEATSGEAAPGERRATKHRGRDRVDRAERGLRDLIGAGPSQLGVSGALRGRDVNRPSEQDLAEAERDIVLIRRHWTPPPGKSDGPSAST